MYQLRYYCSCSRTVSNDEADKSRQRRGYQRSPYEQYRRAAGDPYDGRHTLDTLDKEDKVAVVRYLDNKGAFLIKKSAERVADFLGISRFTVYNYLNEAQEEA